MKSCAANHAASRKGRVLFLADRAMPGPAAGDKGLLSQAWLLPQALACGWREADLTLLPAPNLAIAERLATMTALEDSYVRFATHLAAVLNAAHGTDLPLRSWELLVNSWLQVFLHTIHDRHARLRLAAQIHGKDRLVVPALDRGLRLTRDFVDFVEGTSYGGAGVLELYGAVARRMGLAVEPFGADAPPLIPRYLPGGTSPEAPADAAAPVLPPRVTSPGGRILAYGCWPPGAFLENGLVSLYEPGTGRPEGRALDRRTLAMTGFEPRDEFERIAAELLPQSLPPALAEEFAGAAAAAEPFCGYRAYFSPYWVIAPMDVRTIAALACARGAKILGWQHGGTYGQVLNCPTEWLERRVCHAFATWGWDDGDATLPRVQPLPHLYFQNRRDTWTGGGDKALWASATAPKHTFRYQLYSQDSTVLPLQHRMRRDFADGLEPGVLAGLRLRPYLYDYGWADEDEALVAAHPGMEASCSGPLDGHLTTARLFVCDHLGTSMLEALLVNVPTVLIWDRGQVPEREAARPLFDALRSAGILFHDAAEAARQVNAVWPDPARWWNGDAVQAARRLFLDNQCRTAPDTERQWREFFEAWS